MLHLISEDSPPEIEPVALADCDLSQMARFAKTLFGYQFVVVARPGSTR